MSIITTAIDATIDLDAGVCHPRKLHKVLVWGNNQAHEFRLFCQRNEQDVELVNATVTLYCTRADGVTVTVEGAARGNVASAKLNQQCYAVEGPAQISMEIAVFESRATHAVWNAMVVKTQTSTIAEDGVVPSVGELLAQLQGLDEVVHVTLSENGTTASHTSTELVGLAGESKQPLLVKGDMVIPYVGTDADGNAIFRQMQYDPATQTIIEDEVLVGTDGTASYTRTERDLLKNLVDGEQDGSLKIPSAAAEGALMHDGATEYHIGVKAMALGPDSMASGAGAVAFGAGNEARGQCSVVSGYSCRASGQGAVAFGLSNEASGNQAFTVGCGNSASGERAVALGDFTQAKGYDQTVIGRQNVPDEEGKYAFIIGNGDRETAGEAYQSNTFTVGWKGEVSSGKDSQATGEESVAMGFNNDATGYAAIALGTSNQATGDHSFAAGGMSHATEQLATALGAANKATAQGATAVGWYNKANGEGSFAAGSGNTASGKNANAIGASNEATGQAAFAAGKGSSASGDHAIALGQYAKAEGSYQVVLGHQNIPDPEGRYAFIVGNAAPDAGYGENYQSNGMTIDRDGNAWFKGEVYAGGTSQDDAQKLARAGDVPGIFVTTYLWDPLYRKYFADHKNSEIVVAHNAGKMCVLVDKDDDGSFPEMLLRDVTDGIATFHTTAYLSSPLTNNTRMLQAWTATVSEDGYAQITTHVPAKTPNPFKLKLTGAVEAEYDGSEEVEINIPQGGGISDPGTAHQQLVSDANGKAVWVDRLAYKTTGQVEILPETALTYGGPEDGLELHLLTTLLPTALEADKVYNVVYNGTAYECPCVLVVNESGTPSEALCLGNMTAIGMEGGNADAPFALMYSPEYGDMSEGMYYGIFAALDGATSVTISITGEGTVYKKLPGEYLPDNRVITAHVPLTKYSYSAIEFGEWDMTFDELWKAFQAGHEVRVICTSESTVNNDTWKIAILGRFDHAMENVTNGGRMLRLIVPTSFYVQDSNFYFTVSADESGAIVCQQLTAD